MYGGAVARFGADGAAYATRPAVAPPVSSLPSGGCCVAFGAEMGLSSRDVEERPPFGGAPGDEAAQDRC